MATKIDEATRANRRLRAGATVVSNEDGEPGQVVRVCTHRRSGVDAWSYVVETKYGREIWDAGELFVPTDKGEEHGSQEAHPD